MLSCEQFRFLATAAPRELTPMQRLHLLLCRACSGEYRQLKSLDERINEALLSDPMAVRTCKPTSRHPAEAVQPSFPSHPGERTFPLKMER